MNNHKIFQSTLAWRAILISGLGSAGCTWWQWNVSKEKTLAYRHCHATSSSSCLDRRDWPTDLFPKGMTLISQTPKTLSEGISPHERRPNSVEFDKQRIGSSKTKHYDFVIIGNGNAGRHALQELQKQCPGASIAIIDPLRKKRPVPSNSKTEASGKIHFHSKLASSIDPRARLVSLVEEDNSSTVLSYKFGVLLATGSTGSPPPGYLIDKQAWAHVMELRPTHFPQLEHTLSTKDDQSNTTQRQFLHPAESRQNAIQAAEKGKTVGVLGSGWDALDLAVACAQASSGKVAGRRGRRVTRRAAESRPQLLYGATGPLSHVLPQYLVSAVAKRLRSKRIRLQERTLVRYVSYDERHRRLGVYSAKAHDVLDSQRLSVDCLVIAPDVRGTRGNATLPTPRIPDHLRDSSEGRPWYATWSQLSTVDKMDPPMLLCYHDDGRVAVNSELCACTGVYAAGSVAKSGNAFTGDAQVAGSGTVDAAKAGRVAASNMARHYHDPVILSFGSSNREERVSMPIKVQDPCPVWRSDVLSYDSEQPSSLSSVGISALCIGTCDSERLTTHGVFWTNQAAQQRFMRQFSNNLADDELRSRAKQQAKNSPVYGIGVVFFLDSSGKIQGVMTWGLPFARDDLSLKTELVEQIKQVIQSNMGGIVPGSSEALEFFATESKKLVHTSFSNREERDATTPLDKSGKKLNLEDFPRPLHRYTPIWMTQLAFRKRRQGVQGVVPGEDLFARSLHPSEVPDIPPPKPVAGVGFSDPSNQMFQAATNMHEYQLWEQKEKRWEENQLRACPPKEDQVWIRKGFEDRSTNVADQRMEDFGAILQRRHTFQGNRSNAST